jgi:two-component system OmpR family response regulator
MKVLLIEDDEFLGDGLKSFLQSDGYRVDWCQELGQARILSTEPYDAFLLDWQLPDGSGVDWLSRRREGGDATPAIVLTARDQVADRIKGLDSGADDFLVKPFAPEELTARLRALMRRVSGLHREWKQGGLTINLTSRIAQRDMHPIDLTSREWAVFESLMLRQGRVVSNAELESLVLGHEGELASNALQVHISNLRQKLGRELIETVRGLGYRIPKKSS